MVQSALRLQIFGLWVAFWLISTLGLTFAPWIRADQAIHSGQIISSILTVTGIWLPPLTCFASFWFPQDEKERSRKIVVSKERYIAALILSISYLLFVLLLIFWPVYIIEYTSTSLDLPAGQSLQERLGESVKIALLTSPIALAPIGWLTNNVESESFNTDKREET